MPHLESSQPSEQAGYSTVHHIHTINQLIEKYTQPLYMAFIDHEKAFDSVGTSAVMQALRNQGVDEHYVSISATVLAGESSKTPTRRRNLSAAIRRGPRWDTTSTVRCTPEFSALARGLQQPPLDISVAVHRCTVILLMMGKSTSQREERLVKAAANSNCRNISAYGLG